MKDSHLCYSPVRRYRRLVLRTNRALPRIASLAVAFGLIVGLVGCSGGSGDAGNGRNTLIPALEATQSQYGALPLVERLSGVVKAKNQVEIYAEISAVVEAVEVENGEEVRKGQPLVRLRDREFQERLKQAQAAHQIAVAQARQAEARLNEVQAESKRTEALAEKNLVNEAELESARTKAISAEADVELARARVDQAAASIAEEEEALTRTVIRAPVDGTIGGRQAEVGMRVGTGTRLLTLGQLDTVRVDIILTDRMLNYIETGQRAGIRTASIPTGELSAKLTRISPFLHPVTHSTEGEIDMPNPNNALKSGMFVTVDIYYGESEKATLVPMSALYDNPLSGVTGVYVAADSLGVISAGASEKGSLTEPVDFEFAPVEVIAKGRMSAGVAGIEPGAWVVTLGQDLLGGEPGQAKVRPVDWTWVENLQNLQSEDLLQEVMRQKRPDPADSVGPGL